MEFTPLDRRQVLARSVRLAALLAGAGLLPRAFAADAPEAPPASAASGAAGGWNAAAFEAKSIDAAIKALGLAAPVASPEVALTAPEIAENGAVVPVIASSVAPGVRRLALLVDKNPNVLSAVFEVGDRVDPEISTRIKMAQTADVYAVAITADGRVLFATQQVKVTIGGCGG